MQDVDREVQEAMDTLEELSQKARSTGLFWHKIRKKVNRKTEVLGDELRAEKLRDTLD